MHMGILDELLGGGQRQKEYRDFVARYEQGDPSEGYSDREVLQRYGDVSHAVPPNQYAQAAIEALGKLSPEDRAAFLKMLQERAATLGVALPRQVTPEPKELGKVLTDLHGKPGQLRDMLGGGDVQSPAQAQRSNPIIDMLGSPQAKAVLAGIAAMVVKRVMQGASRTA
jgi:hypothetical protein